MNGTPGWGGYYLSAYGLAVKHGFVGTEEEWLASLKGARVVLEVREDMSLWQRREDETEWTELGKFGDLYAALQETAEKSEAAAQKAEGIVQAAGAAQEAVEQAITNTNSAVQAAQEAVEQAVGKTDAAMQAAQETVEQAVEKTDAAAREAQEAANQTIAAEKSANAAAQAANEKAALAETNAGLADTAAANANTAAEEASAAAQAGNAQAEALAGKVQETEAWIAARETEFASMAGHRIELTDTDPGVGSPLEAGKILFVWEE